MPPPSDELSSPTSIQSLPLVASASAIRLPKNRQSAGLVEDLVLSRAETNPPFRRSHPSAASIFASTLTPPGSRSLSPVGGRSPSRVSLGPGFDPSFGYGPSGGGIATDTPGSPPNIILHSFAPSVAICSSPDTDELLREKGFSDGLFQLLRPFGEQIQGKVTIRDSNGSSKSHEDFSIRFVKFRTDPEPEVGYAAASAASAADGSSAKTSLEYSEGAASRGRTALAEVEALLERHLSFAEDSSLNPEHRPAFELDQGPDREGTSAYYTLYLRRLLCGISITPYETFAHPVACVIAISSRSRSPIEELSRLYAETRDGTTSLPGWVDPDYLRYYVLIHEEERDDISRSMALFDQMKRHFGLHCHLLRLRSTRSAQTDDDSLPLPQTDRLSAAEELAAIARSQQQQDDLDDSTIFIFESDATAIRSFVREMVTQSIVPTMERHITVWNDQIASRRRGITGRFMSFSRKWAGLGTASRSSSTSSPAGGATNFDPLGFYSAETAEAIMRRLADFALMLRDWKLAYSTYDLLRSDFADSKAWKYHAAANEMAAVSLLLLLPAQNLSAKMRAETTDQMLEAAFYSYHTRCGQPYEAVRALLLGIELLSLRGGSGVDDAVRWGTRLLDSKLVGPVGEALIKERLAIFYASKPGAESNWRGTRKRKSAVWWILSAEAWIRQGKPSQAQRCLNDAKTTYDALPGSNPIDVFSSAGQFILGLQLYLDERLRPGEAHHDDGRSLEDDGSAASFHGDEESEPLDGGHDRRPSAVGRMAIPPSALETAPLHRVDIDSANMSQTQQLPGRPTGGYTEEPTGTED